MFAVRVLISHVGATLVSIVITQEDPYGNNVEINEFDGISVFV